MEAIAETDECMCKHTHAERSLVTTEKKLATEKSSASFPLYSL